MADNTRSPIWHLVAILIGLYFVCDLGAAQSTSQGAATTQLLNPVRVKYLFVPNDIVNIVEGTPYTVPAGKVLIITDWAVSDADVPPGSYGLQTSQFTIHPRIIVDSVERWGGGFETRIDSPSSGNTTIAGNSTGGGFLTGVLASGIRANAGQIVTLSAGANYPGPTMFAAGYLSSVVQPSGVLRIKYIPDPNEIVNITQSSPYTVPAGKVLIITDFAVPDASVPFLGGTSIRPRLKVDGVEKWGAGYGARSNYNNSPGVYDRNSTGGGFLSGSLTSGIRANAGQVVTLDGSGLMFAAGYLATTQ